jgi:hypothetical protein
MTQDERDEVADQYGYQRGRCPKCGRTVWSDTASFDCSCGWRDEPEPEESEADLCADCDHPVHEGPCEVERGDGYVLGVLQAMGPCGCEGGSEIAR